MIIFQMKAAVAHLRRADPVMAKIIRRVGPCQLAVLQPNFETLARSITFQQLHGKAAATIFARVQKAVGRSFTATAFLKAEPETLRACGLSRQKLASLTDLAEHVVRRQINFRKLAALDNDAVIEILTQVRGVGSWTAQIFLMFALGRNNVLPAGDFGIRNAVRQAYGLKEMPKAAELEEIARCWHPYCTVASWYLWRSLDGAADLK
jgi:DNA-3-methyladenine glycosylase II